MLSSVSVLWVQVPGIGPKAKGASREWSRHCSEREEGLWRWKALQKKERGSRGGGREGKQSWVYFLARGGVGWGGVGRSRITPWEWEQSGRPCMGRLFRRCTWLFQGASLHCYWVWLWGMLGSFPFWSCVHVWLSVGGHCEEEALGERDICILLKDQSRQRRKTAPS